MDFSGLQWVPVRVPWTLGGASGRSFPLAHAPSGSLHPTSDRHVTYHFLKIPPTIQLPLELFGSVSPSISRAFPACTSLCACLFPRRLHCCNTRKGSCRTRVSAKCVLGRATRVPPCFCTQSQPAPELWHRDVDRSSLLDSFYRDLRCMSRRWCLSVQGRLETYEARRSEALWACFPTSSVIAYAQTPEHT